jgi:excisionase family DNA binding protein
METVTQRTTRRDQRIATKSVSGLSVTAAALSKKKADTVKIKIQESGEFINVPKKALELLFYIVSTMAEGRSISLIPSDSDVSTQQAADILNVSRPHVVKLLEKGIIPYKKVGSHRRIKLQDVMTYDEKLRAQRSANLMLLAKQAQVLGLGY